MTQVMRPVEMALAATIWSMSTRERKNPLTRADAEMGGNATGPRKPDEAFLFLIKFCAPTKWSTWFTHDAFAPP